MDIEDSNEVVRPLLGNDEVLTGVVKKPFLMEGKLFGAILSFAGRRETALLHRKQMTGNDRDERLANLNIGDEITVKIIVQGETPNRKTWATEVGLDDIHALEQILSAESRRASGRVVNTADYGVFVEILAGPAAGRKGLIHSKNMTRGRSTSLGAFTTFHPGRIVEVEVMDGRIDDKNVMRLDLAFVA